MAYTGRDWDNTGTKVTKEDFKRMETGIKSNDTAIAEQAIKIEDNTNGINKLSNKLNVQKITYSNLLNGWTLPWGTYKLNVARCGNIVMIYGVVDIGTVDVGTVIAELPSWANPKEVNIVTCCGTTNYHTSTSFKPPILLRVLQNSNALTIQASNDNTSGSFCVNFSYEGVDL